MSLDHKIDEFNKLFSGLWTDAIKSKYRSLCAEIIETQLSQNKYAGTDLQDKYDQVMHNRRVSSSNQYYFITICPYEDIQFKDFKKVVDKVVKKKWFTKYVYVYEQRQSEIDKPFYGIHSHIIVSKGTMKKSDVIREVYNTCKDVCGSKQSIDVKLLITEEDLDIRLRYILGTKATEDKQKKQEIDKIFRQQNSIEPHYKMGDWKDKIE